MRPSARQPACVRVARQERLILPGWWPLAQTPVSRCVTIDASRGGGGDGGYTIKHDDELERDYGKWVLVRRSLGLSAFGMNTVELPPGESIPEHDETERDQEEVFFVLAGPPTMVIEGVDHPLRPGSCVRLDPRVDRTVRNDGEGLAKVLIMSAPRTSGYETWAGRRRDSLVSR